MSTDALEAVLTSRRRTSSHEGPRMTFSLARAEALGRLRHRHGLRRWAWVATLARSVLCLTGRSDLRFHENRVGAVRRTLLGFAFDPAALRSMPPLPLLDVALEPVGAAVRSTPAQRLTRAQRLLGRAVNEALALGPSLLVVRTPTHQHTFVPGDASAAVIDYDERITAATGSARYPLEFEIHLESIIEGLDRMAANVGAHESLAVIHRAVPGATVEAYGGVLRTMPDLPHVRLGAAPIARYWPTPREPGLRLLVDGVLVGADLDGAMRDHGVDLSVLAGIIDAHELTLTFDERSVVPTPATTLLAAWLHDLVARGKRWPVGGPRGRHAIVDCQWPSSLARVHAADGRSYSLGEMAQAATAGIPAVVTWPHEAAAVPPQWRARTLVIWPSDLEVLRRDVPQLAIVPASQVRLDDASARGDWTALAEASLPLFSVGRTVAETEPMQQLDVSAFIHRTDPTDHGSAVLLRGGVACAHENAPERTIAGVALLVHAREDTPAILLPPNTPSPRTRALLEHARRFVRGRMHELVAHACAHVTTAAHVEGCAFLRAELTALTGAVLQLHREDDAQGMLRWIDHPLLACAIGQRHDGAPFTLGAALAWARSQTSVSPALADACVPSALGAMLWSRLFAAVPTAATPDPDPPTAPADIPAVVRAGATRSPEAAHLRVDLTDGEVLGHLDVLLEGDSDGVTITLDGIAVIATVLPPPFASLRGELALRERSHASPEALQALLARCGWRSHALATQAMARTDPSSPRHGRLRRFVVAARPFASPVEPLLELGRIDEHKRDEGPAVGLAQRCGAALAQPLGLTPRVLSWAAVALRGGRLQIGARHPWIGAALRGGASPRAQRLAATLIVAKLLSRSSASARRICDALTSSALVHDRDEPEPPHRD